MTSHQKREIFLTNDAFRVINYAYFLMNVILAFIKRPVSLPKFQKKALILFPYKLQFEAKFICFFFVAICGFFHQSGTGNFANSGAFG